MATIQERNQSFRVLFCYHGKRHTLKLGCVTRQEAEAKSDQIDYLLMRIKQKLLVVPPGLSIEEFMLHDGKTPVFGERTAADTHSITFGQLKEKYLATHRNGALEQNSLTTLEIHLRHFQATHGDGFPIQDLRPADLQRHIDR